MIGDAEGLRARRIVYRNLIGGTVGVLMPTLYFAAVGKVYPGTLVMPLVVVIAWLIYIATPTKGPTP